MKYGAFLNSIKNHGYYYIDYDYLKMIIKNNDENFFYELNCAISLFDKTYKKKKISEWNIETLKEIYKLFVINYLSINKLVKKYIKYNNDYTNINMNDLLSKYAFYKFILSPSVKNRSQDICPICLDFCNFPITTACNHTFCCSCLIKTSKHLNSCPYCRNDTIINPITNIIKDLIPNDDFNQYQPYNNFHNSLLIEQKFNNTSYDIVSDLHIDQWSYKYNIKYPCGKVVESPHYFNKSESDILIVAGDVSDDVNTTLDYLDNISKNYKRILFVDGNHEHVNKYPNLYTTHEIYSKIIKLNNNKIVYIPITPYKIGSTVFIGCCGWWNYNNNSKESISTNLSYFNNWIDLDTNQSKAFIDNVTKQSYNDYNTLVNYLKYFSKDKSINNIIIVTHTVPKSMFCTKNSNDTEHNTLFNNITNYDKISHWIFGHTHQKINVFNNNINFIANPRGRPEDYNRIHYDTITVNLSNNNKFIKFRKIHLLPLAFFSAYVVKFLTKVSNRKLENILFQSNFIIIDYWFFIHVLNTNLVVLAYKESISRFWFMFCVLGWEVLENVIIPNLHPSLSYYREITPNTIGDIVAAIPAFLCLKYGGTKVPQAPSY